MSGPIAAKCIEVNHVTFKAEREVILDDVSFSVQAGDYVGIIGPNGGGKTTLLKIILGLIKPDTGQVKVFGQNIFELKEERAHIGFVPQRAAQDVTDFPASVEEIVASGRTARLPFFKGLSKSDYEAIDSAFTKVGIDKLRKRRIGDLSGGERQKVFIARALAGEPQILILDEPTVGVDITSQEQFYDFLAKLNHESGLTVMFVSHDIDIVAREVHKLLALNKNVIYFGEAKGALTSEYLEQIYGRKVKFAFHEH